MVKQSFVTTIGTESVCVLNHSSFHSILLALFCPLYFVGLFCWGENEGCNGEERSRKIEDAFMDEPYGPKMRKEAGHIALES